MHLIPNMEWEAQPKLLSLNVKSFKQSAVNKVFIFFYIFVACWFKNFASNGLDLTFVIINVSLETWKN
jgi:hypothetical protein